MEYFFKKTNIKFMLKNKNNKKTVLFITHGLPPESYGGVEVYTNNLYKEFKKSKKFQTLLLSRTKVNKFWELLIFSDLNDPNKFYIYTQTKDFFNIANKGFDDAFKEFLFNTKPDIIHFQHYLHFSITWFEIIKTLLPKTKIILTLHEYGAICANSGQMIKTKWQGKELCYKASYNDCVKCFPYMSKNIIKKRFENVNKYFSFIDLFIAPSEFLKQRYISYGFPEKKFYVSENGQQVFKPKIRKKSKKLRLIYIGQINYFKGLHILLKAMEILRSQTQIYLDIHGKFQDDEEYNFKILNLVNNLKNVKFCGPYSQNQLPKILSKYDLVIVPSIWWENSPLVIQEAYMAKLPIICSDIGGMAEKVKNNISGLHFKVGNSADLANKILKIYKNRNLLKKFEKNIKPVKSIKENRIELENLYLKL